MLLCIAGLWVQQPLLFLVVVITLRAILPELVLFPRSTEQVSECARVCYDQSIHMIPFGTGTGLEGGILPIHVCTGILYQHHGYPYRIVSVNYLINY